MNSLRKDHRTGERILLVGGGSAIGEAIARKLANPERRIIITGRRMAELEATAADLQIRGYAQAEAAFYDPSDSRVNPVDILELASERLDGVDMLIWGAGLLPDEPVNINALEPAEQVMRVNATAAIAMASAAAQHFARQGGGQIVAIGSVAGDRGRASNALYGAAKDALATYLSGLDQAMEGSNVKVLCVKPGLIDTPMTATFPKGSLWSTPAQVAADVVKAIEKGRRVTYTPRFWAVIMLIIRLIPAPLFRRLRF